jgi:maleate cis-trans isomerase
MKTSAYSDPRISDRRAFLAGGAAALAFASAPARASNYRGVVGDIKPRADDSSLVDMIRLLPEGIGVIPVYLNLQSGTREEYGSHYDTYEQHIAYLASQKVNVISVEGAPPFMLLGPKREAEMLDGWKAKYKTDMFTSSQNQVNVMRALKVKKILVITSGSGGAEMDNVYRKYFEDSGIGVAAVESMKDVKFAAVREVPREQITAFITQKFAAHKDADAVYILGSALEALPLIAPLERELKVPVVQPIAARIWEIERRLKVHEPIKGYGRLLETLPA